MFPLNEIGKNFSGYLGNIKAYNKALSTEELAAENVGATLVDVARNRGAYADLGNKGYKGDEMRLYPAWKATDGDGHVTGTSGVSTSYESRWCSSDRNDDFLMIDLGRERKVSKVVIDWAAGRYATAYDIQVSNDGADWSTVKSVSGNEKAWTEDSFTETSARYVRMKGVQRKASEYAICEMKVYQSVDRSVLKNAYEEAKTILKNTKADFAYASANTDELAELWNASVRAKAVYGDVMAGQEELDAAKAELESAQECLPEKSYRIQRNSDGRDKGV